MRSEIVAEDPKIRQENFYSEEPLTEVELDELRIKAREWYRPGDPFTPDQIEAIKRFVLEREDSSIIVAETVPGFAILECRIAIKGGIVSELYGHGGPSFTGAIIAYPVDPNHIPEHPSFRNYPEARAIIQYTSNF